MWTGAQAEEYTILENQQKRFWIGFSEGQKKKKKKIEYWKQSKYKATAFCPKGIVGV